MRPNFKLRLYVLGRTAQSQRAIDNIRCIGDAQGGFEVEVVDVLEHPLEAERAKILATPTLVKLLPEPVRKIIGDLSDTQRVLLALGIYPVAPEPHEGWSHL